MGLRDNPDAQQASFWREGWDVEGHPGFPLSYDVHRGKRFVALDRSYTNSSWFRRAVSMQESLLISPHELVEKVQLSDRARRLSHITAQIAVKTIALHNARVRSLDLGFDEEMLDWEVGELADEYAVRPGRDMLRYLALILGGYSQRKRDNILRRMVNWGTWDERDVLEAVLTELLPNMQAAIEAGNAALLGKIIDDAVPGLENNLAGGRGKGRPKPKPGESSRRATGADGEEGDDEPPGCVVAPPIYKRAINYTPPEITNWWGRMDVVHPPLLAHQQIIRRVYARKSTDSGTAPYEVSRVLTDQKVFRESRPTIKGSVLIDGSGSMGLTSEEIIKICSEIPGAVIGVYCGSTDWGRLIIAAVNGRIVDFETLQSLRPGGSNVVDGPALEWLMTQPRPRVWVSDGHVTGVGDGTCEEVRKDAERIRVQGHISRIDAIKEAPGVIRYLRAKKG